MFGNVLRAAWTLYLAWFPRSLAVVAVLLAPLELAGALFDPTFGALPNRALYGALLLAVAIVGYPGGGGALTRLLADGREAREASISSAYERVAPRLATLVVATFVASLATLVGLVLLVVPGLVVAARWLLVVPVVVLEGASVGRALARSNELVRGHTAVVAALLLVVTAAAVAVAIVPAGLAFLVPHFLGSWLGSLVFDLVLAPWLTVVAFALYKTLAAP